MKKRIGLLGLIGLIGIACAWAVPAHPGWQAFVQPDGTQILLQLQGDEYYHYLIDQNGQAVVKGEDGFYRPQEKIDYRTFLRRRAAAKARRRSPARAAQFFGYNPAPRGIVLFVEFPDKRCQSTSTHESMSEMCNGDNYTYGGAYGSARKYFEDQSGNTYSPQFDFYGPVLLSHNLAYYGENDASGDDMRVPEAIIEACQFADTAYNVDFSLYDSDLDGQVDFIYLIYAGHGENFAGADPDYIWPHQWSVLGYTGWDDRVILDGVALATYACSSELSGLYGSTRCGIGTLCHEFSHVLGLPDYYDTEYGENYENNLYPNTWDIMAGGSYNLDGKSPCNYSVHEKYQFGWATPILLAHTQEVTMGPSEDYYYISLDEQPKLPSSPDTVYYLENRQKKGWDRGVEGHGMLIWRMVFDEDKWNANEPNNTPGKPGYMYIPASGYYAGGSGGDPYPGTSRVTSFEVPNTVYSLVNISESGSTLNFRCVVGCDGYTVQVNASHVDIEETQTSRCYEANAPYTATLTPKKNYRIKGVSVTMGGQPLSSGVDFTYVAGVLTIPSLTGDVVINVLTEKIPFPHEHCMYFFWQPDSAVHGSDVELSGIRWALTVTGSSYRGYDTPAQDRGAQFGSRSTSPESVSLHTTEMSSCLITSVQVVACVASGSGLLEVIVDDETIGKANLGTDITGYEFTNPEEWHGALDIRFSNLQKSLFIKKIVVHFADETDNPEGLDNVRASVPQGEITGIYSVTGQPMGCRVEDLPRGLYLVAHTDGVEKIIVR